jgi:hypothetical protein
MMQIKALAPTLNDALKAVELGCRKIQNDPCFVPDMSSWMTIVTKDMCVGCLATSTLMQLSNKTGKDIINRFSSSSNPIQIVDRAFAFDIEQQVYRENEDYTDFSFFEAAIDSLRHSELLPLLKFYGLDQHKNAREAVGWFARCYSHTKDYGTGKRDLLFYADFIQDKVIPKMQELLG